MHPRLGNAEFVEDWTEKVLQDIAEAKRSSIAGLKDITGKGRQGQGLSTDCPEGDNQARERAGLDELLLKRTSPIRIFSGLSNTEPWRRGSCYVIDFTAARVFDE
jgi:hypothetical protein